MEKEDVLKPSIELHTHREHKCCRETTALLKILEMGDRKFDDGQGVPAWKVFEQLRRKKGIEL